MKTVTHAERRDLQAPPARVQAPEQRRRQGQRRPDGGGAPHAPLRARDVRVRGAVRGRPPTHPRYVPRQRGGGRAAGSVGERVLREREEPPREGPPLPLGRLRDSTTGPRLAVSPTTRSRPTSVPTSPSSTGRAPDSAACTPLLAPSALEPATASASPSLPSSPAPSACRRATRGRGSSCGSSTTASSTPSRERSKRRGATSIRAPKPPSVLAHGASAASGGRRLGRRREGGAGGHSGRIHRGQRRLEREHAPGHAGGARPRYRGGHDGQPPLHAHRPR